MLNKTKKYKKLLLKLEIIANILNVVSCRRKEFAWRTFQISCKARAVNLKKFSTCLKPRELRDVLPLVEQNLIREEISIQKNAKRFSGNAAKLAEFCSK